MYGKIFVDIFDSTLIVEGGWLPTYVFMSMITLADKDGLVEIAPQALYRRLGLSEGNPTVTMDDFNSALSFLEKPDPYSKAPDHDGRRIIPLRDVEEHDGNRGWLIVNAAKYRAKASKREPPGSSTPRVQKHRQDKSTQSNQEPSPERNGKSLDVTDETTGNDLRNEASTSPGSGIKKNQTVNPLRNGVVTGCNGDTDTYTYTEKREEERSPPHDTTVDAVHTEAQALEFEPSKATTDYLAMQGIPWDEEIVGKFRLWLADQIAAGRQVTPNSRFVNWCVREKQYRKQYPDDTPEERPEDSGPARWEKLGYESEEQMREHHEAIAQYKNDTERLKIVRDPPPDPREDPRETDTNNEEQDL